MRTPSVRPRLALATTVLALILAGCSDGDRQADSPTAPPPPPPVPQPQSAVYEVTFDATWTRASHPVDFPRSPHFSPLVGGTHDRRARFWGDGLFASEGIERMAEMGRVSPLDTEIQRAVGAGSAGTVFKAAAGISSPGSDRLTFTATQTHPMVTLVTMVAPSPDWFVGVSGLDLFPNGVWEEQVVIPLLAWDAGTDDGASFESADVEAAPHAPIELIRAAPVSPNGTLTPMGTFTFRRIG